MRKIIIDRSKLIRGSMRGVNKTGCIFGQLTDYHDVLVTNSFEIVRLNDCLIWNDDFEQVINYKLECIGIQLEFVGKYDPRWKSRESAINSGIFLSQSDLEKLPDEVSAEANKIMNEVMVEKEVEECLVLK